MSSCDLYGGVTIAASALKGPETIGG